MPSSDGQDTLLDPSSASAFRDILLAEIDSANGALPFRRFMELALYHPRFGYYMGPRARIGRQGDFVTAPEMTSLFGQLLTLQWIEVWERLGRPDRFHLVEAGAGTGILASDILRTARRFSPFFHTLTYTILEISPDFRQRQRATLQDGGVLSERVRWMDGIDTLSDLEGVIFSNEFLDAFPVHWVEMTAEGLREIAVRWAGDEFATTHIPLTMAPERIGILDKLAVGSRTEVGVAAAEWMEMAGRVLRRGLLLAIDYGYADGEMASTALASGTLVGHHEHQRVDNPLLHPGEMDLTAHVNFSTMARAGEGSGLETAGYATQAWFLMGLGILERLEAVNRREADADKRERLRQTVLRLTMPQGMGERFKVLAQGRGLGPEPLSGFRLNNRRDRLFSTVSV